MKAILFNRSGRLRNGWWIVIMCIALAVLGFGAKFAGKGLVSLGIDKEWLGPLPVVVILLATWFCTRLRKEPLSSIGLRLNGRWLRQFGAGTGLGVAAMLLAVSMIWAAGGVSLSLNPDHSLGALAYGLYMFFFAAAVEELLFRGFIFQRLIAGSRVWIAQLVMAIFFALAHWNNPGMTGTTQIIAEFNIAVAAVFLGFAYIRTGSLALPLGIHLGWNWTQGTLLGFGVSGFKESGWFTPEFLGKPQWLTGGDFGPEASAFGLVVIVLLAAALWKWKGTVGRGSEAVSPIASAPTEAP